MTFTNFTCPQGGSWYACDEAAGFIGCCAADPCSNGCSDGNLYPASFDKTQYNPNNWPSDQQCNSGSQFWTCAGITVPFWGCCKTNACSDGCTQADLTAAFLSTNPNSSAPFVGSTSSSATSSATSSTSSSSTATPASKQSNTGTIAGAVVGGVLGLAVIVGIIFIYLQHLKRRNRRAPPPEDQPSHSKTYETPPVQQHKGSAVTPGT